MMLGIDRLFDKEPSRKTAAVDLSIPWVADFDAPPLEVSPANLIRAQRDYFKAHLPAIAEEFITLYPAKDRSWSKGRITGSNCLNRSSD